MRLTRTIAAAIILACAATLQCSARAHSDTAAAAAAAAATHSHTQQQQPDPAAAFGSLPWGFSATGVPLQVTSGSLPSWLRGSLYRNGPGFYPNVSSPHWFDGMALLQAMHFRDGAAVTYDAAFVGSLEYNFSGPISQEQRSTENENDSTEPASPFSLSALASLASNLSAAAAASDDDADAASSCVRNWAPHISVNTAVTIQELNGHLLTSTATTSSNEFGAETASNVACPFVFDDEDAVGFLMGSEHRRRGPDGSLYHFAYSPSWAQAGEGNYTLYRMRADPSGGEGRAVREVFGQLAYRFGQNYQHSFSVTARYMLLCEVPVPLPQVIEWSAFVLTPNVSTYFRLVDLASGAEVATFQTEADAGFFDFHHINAFENTDDATGVSSVVLDLIAYPDATVIPLLSLRNLRSNYSQIMQRWSEARTLRFVLPLNSSSTPDQIVTVRAIDLQTPPIEMPATNPAVEGRPYQYAYAMGSSGPKAAYYDTIVKLDMSLDWDGGGGGDAQGEEQQQQEPQSRVVQSWQSAGCMTAEPLFVASPSGLSEDDGLLLSLVLDSVNVQSFVLVLNATSFDEVARVQLPQVMPAGFHGLWSTLGVADMDSEFKPTTTPTTVAETAPLIAEE